MAYNVLAVPEPRSGCGVRSVATGARNSLLGVVVKPTLVCADLTIFAIEVRWGSLLIQFPQPDFGNSQ